MAIINSHVARPLPPVQARPVASKSVDPLSEERETEKAPAASLRRSALATALAMSDDMSGLVASMRRARAKDDGASDVRGQAWLDHVLDEHAPEKVSQLRQQLRHLGAADVAGARELLQQMFPEPSDMLAVLRALLADAELEGLRELLAALYEELATAPGGRRARGGLNAALKARLQAPHLRATARQLRRSYQDFLAGSEPIDTYELWIELYGFDRRTRVLDFIEQALAADMYALDPSCSRLEFGYLLQTVRRLTTLRSADHLLLQHCWQADLMARLGAMQPDLVAALLRMVRNGGGLAELFQGLLAGASYVWSLPEKVRFAQGIRRFLKALPHGLWDDIGLQLQALDEVDVLLERMLSQERTSPTTMHRVEVR